MNLFSGIGESLANFVYGSLIKGVVDWFPLGGLWGLIGLIAGVIIVGAAIVFLTFLLFSVQAMLGEWLESEKGRMDSVTTDLAIPYLGAGALMAILTACKIGGIWNYLFHGVYIAAFAWVFRRFWRLLSMDGCGWKRKAACWLDSIAYMLAMTFLGFSAGVTLITSVFLLIVVVTGIVIGGAMLGMAAQSATTPSCASSGPRRARLTDGTEIEEGGFGWYATNGIGTYHQNFDGTFTRAD